MKRTICIFFCLLIISNLIFSETIICPHCGEAFDYTREIKEEVKNGYKIVSYDVYVTFYENNDERDGSKICIKNFMINGFESGNRVVLRNKNFNYIFAYCENENMLMELMELKNKNVDIYLTTTPHLAGVYVQLDYYELIQ